MFQRFLGMGGHDLYICFFTIFKGYKQLWTNALMIAVVMLKVS
jgi:hypothetical protein